MVYRYHRYHLVIAGLLMLVTLQAQVASRDQGARSASQMEYVSAGLPIRLWQDVNHNGISEPAELTSLTSSNVTRLHLDFKETNRVDRHGNQFRYRARVYRQKNRKDVRRWAWDVYLLTNIPPGS